MEKENRRAIDLALHPNWFSHIQCRSNIINGALLFLWTALATHSKLFTVMLSGDQERDFLDLDKLILI